MINELLNQPKTGPKTFDYMNELSFRTGITLGLSKPTKQLKDVHNLEIFLCPRRSKLKQSPASTQESRLLIQFLGVFKTKESFSFSGLRIFLELLRLEQHGENRFLSCSFRTAPIPCQRRQKNSEKLTKLLTSGYLEVSFVRNRNSRKTSTLTVSATASSSERLTYDCIETESKSPDPATFFFRKQ